MLEVIMNRIALYIRLSKEIDKDEESYSIKNQRDLLNKYVIDNYKNINKNIKEFVDEGFSGTNFNRPAFQKMISHIEKNELDILIVKDLSRLGRNYIESMYYINKVFPLHNVKMISINDNINIDNFSNFEISFKSLVNAYYSKDLSKKIKSGHRNKVLQGIWFSGSFYGYKKSEKEKNSLELDYEASLVIIDIFKMAGDGMKVNEIVKVLNDNHVLTPMEYTVKNKRSDRTKWENKTDEVYWTYDHVWRIIKDERYTGKLIYNKKEVLEVGGKRRKKTDRENWIVIDDVILPIVSKEIFEKAQKVIRKGYNGRKNPSNDVLVNKIVCGKCNRNLKKYIYSYKEQKEVKYNCLFYANTSYDLCFSYYIYREQIEKVIIENVKMQIKIFTDLKKLEDSKKENHNLLLKSLRRHENDLINKINKIKRRKVDTVEDLLNDKISTDEYKKIIKNFEDKTVLLDQEINSVICEKEIMKNKLNTRKTETILETLEKSLKRNNMIEYIAEYIEKILVYDIDRLEIIFNFSEI